MVVIVANILAVLFSIWPTLVVGSIQVQYPGQEHDHLKTVIVLYRHGDRTPIKTYPNDPYNNLSFWPCDWGQLTNLGKLEQYELGKWLRLTYGKFLPPKYSNFDISVRSTDVDRALMSAESNLAGLYPPSDSDSWFKDIKWQPIPIHTVPEKEDAVLAGHKPCPKYERLYSDLFKSGYYADLNSKLGHLYEYMSEHAGYKVDMLQVTHLFSTFYIEELYNYTLPDWTHAVYPDQMRGITEAEFASYCYTDALKRLKIGRLLHEWISLLDSIKKGEKSKKMYMYSGHDTTIANVLMAFNAFNPPHLPPYCSTIILELYDDDTLKIWYKNGTESVSIEHFICTEKCTLADFKDRLEPITIDSQTWEMECSADTPSSIEPILHDPLFKRIQLSMLVILIILLVLTCWTAKNKKKPIQVRNRVK